MQDKKFEHQVKDLLYNHEEAAPNVLNNVFEKRTPLYVFKNKLILNKYKLIAAAAIVGVLAFLINFNLNKTEEQGAEIVASEINNSTQSNIGVQPESNGQVGNQLLEKTDNQANNIADIEKENIQDVNAQNYTGTSIAEDANDIDNATDVKKPSRDLSDILGNLKSRKKYYNKDAGSGTGDPRNKYNERLGDEGTGSTVASSTDKTFTETGKNNSTESTESSAKSVAQDNTINTFDKDEKAVADAADNSSIIENDANTTNENSIASDMSDNPGDEDFIIPSIKQRNWSVSLNTMIGSGNRNLDQDGDLATVVVRDNTESNRLSYGTELLLNYRLLDYLEVYSGFGVFSRREAMSYDYRTEVTDMDVTSKQVVEHHPVFGTRTITVYDTTYSKRTVENAGDFKNSYNHYYIPLGARLTVYDKKFGVFLAVNGGLEIATRTNGVILNDKYEELDISNGFARTEFGKMLGVGVGVTYLAGERFNLVGELKGNLFLSPTNNPTYPITQKDNGYGVSLGVKYDLK